MFSVGQKLWFVCSMRRQPGHEITVSKVGKKWVYFDNDRRRFGMTSMRCDPDMGGSGRVYYTRESHEAEVERETLWRKFVQGVSRQWLPPDDLTNEDIRELAKRLDIKL